MGWQWHLQCVHGAKWLRAQSYYAWLQYVVEASSDHVTVLQVPMSALSLHLQQIWKIIREQKDLDLPAHKVMVAHIRCKDIAREQLAAVTHDQAWERLLEEATTSSELVASFKETAQSLLQSCLFGYDSEAMYFVDSVRSENKQELEAALYAALHAAFAAQKLALQRSLAERFRERLERAAGAASTFTGVLGASNGEREAVVDAAAAGRKELLAEYDGVRSALFESLYASLMPICAISFALVRDLQHFPKADGRQKRSQTCGGPSVRVPDLEQWIACRVNAGMFAVTKLRLGRRRR